LKLPLTVRLTLDSAERELHETTLDSVRSAFEPESIEARSSRRERSRLSKVSHTPSLPTSVSPRHVDNEPFVNAVDKRLSESRKLMHAGCGFRDA